MYSSTRKLHWAVVSRILIKVSLYRHAWLNKGPHDWTQFPAPSPPWRSVWPRVSISSNVVVLSDDQYPPRSFQGALLESLYLHKSRISKCFLSSVPEMKGQRQNIFYIVPHQSINLPLVKLPIKFKSRMYFLDRQSFKICIFMYHFLEALRRYS